MSEPLTLITGILSELAVHSGEEEFVRSETQQAVGVGAAAGLAASGVAGAAVGASIVASSAGDSVEFFSCKLGGEKISGRFSKVSFLEGDEVSFVTTGHRDGATALAAKRPRDHVLWMVPHCSRGTIAHRRFAVRMFFLLLVAFPSFAMSSFLVLGVWFSRSSTPLGAILFAGQISLALGAVAACYYPIRFYRQWLPVARQAERIFAALGYSDPARVDLPRDHKRYCKAQGIKWPYLTDGPWIYRYADPK